MQQEPEPPSLHARDWLDKATTVVVEIFKKLTKREYQNLTTLRNFQYLAQILISPNLRWAFYSLILFLFLQPKNHF